MVCIVLQRCFPWQNVDMIIRTITGLILLVGTSLAAPKNPVGKIAPLAAAEWHVLLCLRVFCYVWRPVTIILTWLFNYPQATSTERENVALCLWRCPAVRRPQGRILRDNGGRVLSKFTASRLL
ncbi:hypothetical protein V8C42DRAFT_102216 [Trichoderma barbatum]